MLGYRYQFMATVYLEQAFKNRIPLAFLFDLFLALFGRFEFGGCTLTIDLRYSRGAL